MMYTHEFGIGDRLQWGKWRGVVLDVAKNGIYVEWDDGEDGWLFTPHNLLVRLEEKPRDEDLYAKLKRCDECGVLYMPEKYGDDEFAHNCEDA